MGLLGVAWSNILVGVLAALLVGLVTRAKTFAYQWYLERQYPVAGKYITTWEDQRDGEEVVVTAPAQVEQRGKSITGTTTMPGDEREWVLQGEISENGYVNGVYYAVDPHDRSVGNFFLYINHDRYMEGLWSGYDEVNDHITSGKYTFTPIFDAFEIRPLEREYIPAVIDIADRRLGKEYLSPELLEESIDGGEHFTKVAVVESDFEDDASLAERLAESVLGTGRPPVADARGSGGDAKSEIVGFCLGAVLSQSELRSYLNVSDGELPEGLRHAERVGVVRTIAVREGFENRGVGTELVGDCIEACIDRGATALCSVGWREDGKVNVGGVMNHYDFDHAAEYDEYWREESVEHDYRCESCGEPPCTCSAVLFTKYR